MTSTVFTLPMEIIIAAVLLLLALLMKDALRWDAT